MITCPHPDCGWQAIAPSERVAHEQYASHVVEVHGEVVDVEVPDGTIEVKHDADDEWQRIPVEELSEGSENAEDDPEEPAPFESGPE
jgi:predicted small metal-binding protein